MFEFFTDKELKSSNESGFKPGSFCINQFLSITHDIYQSFHNSLTARTVFLDISKAFDNISLYKGLLCKFKQNGMSVNLLNIITHFLSLRKQSSILVYISH